MGLSLSRLVDINNCCLLCVSDSSPSVGGFDVDVCTHAEELLHLDEKPSSGGHHQRRGARLAVAVIH